ncbi:MAG: LTA synthase family protein [Faecousia sp.]
MNGYERAVRKCRRFVAPVWEALRGFRQKHYAREWLLLFFWLYLCWCEGIVRINSAQFFWTIGLLTTALFSAVAAMLLYVLCSVFSQRVNRVLELIVCYVLLIFYASQLIYNYKFHFFYSAYSMGNGGQVLEFWRVILHALWVKAVPLLLMLLPAVLLSVYGRVFAQSRIGSRLRRAYFAAGAIALHMAIVLLLPAFGNAPMSPYDLYHETNDLSKGALQLGLLPAFRLDVHRLIFGFDGGELVTPEEPSSLSSEPTQLPSDEPVPVSSETEPVTAPTVLPEYDAAEYNVLDLDFAALAAGEENETVRRLHEYFGMQTPTKKNEKTGIFAGCNLIFITAEGFSYLAIDPELTPTLYRMQTEGMQFSEFYTAYWGVSTSDGEYVNLTGTIPKSGTWSLSDTADNAMPLTMAQQLKREGYSAYAFHDHSYTYYHRDKSHPNLGYIFKAVGNGLEITEQWPESDVEMIDVSTADFVSKEPFHVYYMTVSGHLPYSFDESDNAIAAKNSALVEELPYSEPVRAYLACQIELDRAMELLLQRLEEAGVLENTVIVLTADHYPYGLSIEEQSELAGHELDPHFEIYRNALLIYKKGMEPETVTRRCSALDILPTLSNLFGLDFDSRLYMGQDIFSDAAPFLLFSDRSWMTDDGSYYTIGEELTLFGEKEITTDEIEYYNSITANKFLVSQWILEEDYWRVLFGDNLPPDDLPHDPENPDGTISPESSNYYE